MLPSFQFLAQGPKARRHSLTFCRKRAGFLTEDRFDRKEPDAVFSPFAFSCLSMSKSSQSQQPKSFEAALAELDKIVAAMEAGQLPLEQSIAAYKRGAQLLLFCQNALKDATQQVKLLDAGVLKDFSVDGESTVADRTD
jgi:exodeoxyribonuclease VII small subunit